MQGGYFSYALLAALAIALLIAAVTDLRRREIDNWLTAAVALGAPLFWLASGLSWFEIGIQIALALMIFAVMCLFFALRGMGGGDVKLLTAVALWIEPVAFMTLVVAMGLAGGIVTIAAAAWHIGRRSEGRVPVPYGVAIAAASLWVLATDYLPELPAGLG